MRWSLCQHLSYHVHKFIGSSDCKVHQSTAASTIQYNKVICNARMVSWRAEYEAWACRRGKNGEAGLREGMGEIIHLEVPLKRGKWWVFANFEREFIPYWRCCVTEALAANDSGNCRLWKQVFIVRPETATLPSLSLNVVIICTADHGKTALLCKSG